MKSEFIKSFHPFNMERDMKSFLFLYLYVFRFDSHTHFLFSFQSYVKLSSLSFSSFSWEIAQIYIHVLSCQSPRVFCSRGNELTLFARIMPLFCGFCDIWKLSSALFHISWCVDGKNPCCKWKPISRINTFLSFFVYHIPQALTFFIRQHK